MAKLRATNIEPKTATTLTLGATGDTVTVSSTEVRSNTVKDAGGNNLWTSDGSGTLSNVNSGLAGGGWTRLARTVVTSATSAVAFTNTILTSTYKQYVIVGSDVHITDDNKDVQFQVSTNNGSSYGVTVTGSWFDLRNPSGGGGSIGFNGSLAPANTTNYIHLCDDYANDAKANMGFILNLYDIYNTTFTPKYDFRSSYYHASNYAFAGFGAGYFAAGTAINAINFQATSTTFNGGMFQVYGIS